MRTIIAGSRSIKDYGAVLSAILSCPWKNRISVVLSGRAYGVDRLGEEWAKLHSIHVEPYPADWKKWGKLAGIYRNDEMALKADALIAVWDGKSKGTKNMIETAKRRGIMVHVVTPTPTHVHEAMR